MAISSNLARNVMDQLLANGVVKRGYLGVQIKDVDNADLAAKLGLKDKQGVVVTQVYDNTPASKAGLKDGDVIVSLNGQAVKDGHTLQTTVASLPLGKPVALNILRDAVAKDLQVTIEEQPDRFGNSRVPAQRARHEEAASLNLDKVGVEVADLTADMAKEYGFREDAKGVVITNVERSGLAATAGLRRGMLITKLDRQPVATAAKLKDQLEHASLKEGVLLQVQSPAGGTSYVVIKSS
jgi:serine protease Do